MNYSPIKLKCTELMKRSINFSSVPENLSLVEKLIDEICREYNVDEEHYGNILISITEAVNNAIQHGNKNDPGKNVALECDTDGANGSLFVTVEDQGEGFDFQMVPDPTSPENTEKLSGRGIFLMQNLADKVGFKKNGRLVELNFNLSSN